MCGSDKRLRNDVEALLKSDEVAENFIEEPPAQLAAEVFGGAEIPSAIGRTIGHYKLIERIGSGGMGDVYLADRADQQFEMQVAIKLIKRGMDTESVLRRFQHERQILASLEHPNIARLLDGGTTEDGLPYFVMEYIKGERIDRYADKHRLPLTERLELFRQVCSAVSYAHQRLVVHRDLKPSNILVTPDGAPKLLDFGIAKIIHAHDVGAEAFATVTAAPLLTPEYASPEQIEGAPATTLTDVYSLGAVLYELLSGRQPHHRTTRSQGATAHLMDRGEIEKPSAVVKRAEHAGGLRGDLDNIVLMALRKETTRRYHSVEQFSEDIRRHLAGRPVMARADAMSYRASKFVRRNKVALFAVLVIFVTLLGGIIATAWQARRATLQEQRARAEQARAERRFQDVRKLARSVLFEYHDAIKDLPGSTPVRARLVRDALEYLDRLATEVQGDQSLQRELAAAYERVGDVQGGTMFANLGDTGGAIDSYRKSLGLREAVLRASPDDFEARREIAMSYRKLGLLLWETGDVGGGLENNRKTLRLLESLAGERPPDSALRFDLHKSHDYIGMILQEHGDVAGALEHYGKALKILASFSETEQQSEKIRRAFSVSHEHLGTALLQKGDLENALAYNRKALDARAALSAEFPLNAEYRRTLLVSYYNEGEILAKMGRDREALESYRKDFAIVEELSAADQQNNQIRDDRAYAHIRIGDMLAKLGDFQEALANYRKCLDLRGEDVKADPSNLWKRASLIEAHAKTAKTLAKMPEPDAALAMCRETLSLMEKTPVEPTNAAVRGFFADTYVDLAEAYSALASGNDGAATNRKEQRQIACDMYRRSLEILNDMRNRAILSAADAAKPEAITRKISECDSALRD